MDSDDSISDYLNDYDTSFYKNCAEADSKIWVKSLTSSGNLPDNIPLEDLNKNALTYFNRAFGENGEFLLCDLSGQAENVEAIKSLYIKTFRRTAAIYLNRLREEELENSKLNKKKAADFALSGKVEASKWFSAIYDASFAEDVNDEDILRVAEITYNQLHGDVTSQKLKNAFIGSFSQEARLLFSILK